MDIEKVVLKYKKNEKGTVVTAYCDAYPNIQGKGPDENKATADFWHAFNNFEDNNAHVLTLQKKVAKQDAANNTSPKKKAA